MIEELKKLHVMLAAFESLLDKHGEDPDGGINDFAHDVVIENLNRSLESVTDALQRYRNGDIMYPKREAK